jgi:hypothetical protein
MGDGTSVGDPKVVAGTVVNGALSELQMDFANANAAAVIIDGKAVPASDKFAIRLSGHGTASVWVQGEGDLSTDSGGLAMLPSATVHSTITIPATHPSLIAVGATVNRLDWTDRAGDHVSVEGFSAHGDVPLDSLAFFSSAGPTTDLRLKPDLVAPGAFVVGAMSRDADPLVNPTSIFADSQFCTPAKTCSVVDGLHAVTLGTSMATPIVAGAVALLFEQDPTLTQDQLLTLLQAGARYPEGNVPLSAQLGAGALFLPGVLDVKRLTKTPVARTPSPDKSWLTLGSGYAHPDPDWTIPALLQLRDADGLSADVDVDHLKIDVERGKIAGNGLERAAPGMYRFQIAPDGNSGGDSLDVAVSYDGRVLLSRSEDIAVDVSVARGRFEARGGCSVERTGTERRDLPLLLPLSLVIASRARRYRSAARRARSRGRMGSSARFRPG